MFIYLIKVQNKDLYKIGISKKISKRGKNLQTGNPFKIDLICSYESDYARKIEKFLHKKYEYTQYNERFEKLKGEWFELKCDDVLKFKEDCESIEKAFKTLKKMGNSFFI